MKSISCITNGSYILNETKASNTRKNYSYVKNNDRLEKKNNIKFVYEKMKLGKKIDTHKHRCIY